jgi:hypothetical protein
VAGEAALLTTGDIFCLAAGALLVLVVAAGLSVLSAAVLLSAATTAFPDFRSVVTASRVSAVAPAAAMVAGLQHETSPAAAASDISLQRTRHQQGYDCLTCKQLCVQ